MADDKPIIIITKKGGHGGHHGGAWKVAYADFVTAMMAFFMVMWLVNSAEVQTKQQIASYFRKPGLFEHGSGTPLMIGEAGILQDAFVASKKNPKKNQTNGEVTISLKQLKDLGKGKGKGKDGKTGIQIGSAEEAKDKSEGKKSTGEDDLTLSKESSQNDLEKELTIAEHQKIQRIADGLIEELKKLPSIKEILGLVNIKLEADGLAIDIMDTENSSMFRSGSAVVQPSAYQAFGKIAGLLQALPNKVEIVGHTDSSAFGTMSRGFSNWELSADRANAARRLLVAQGLDESRILSVSGRADRDLKYPGDPQAPENRRIAIKVKFRENLLDEYLKSTKQTVGGVNPETGAPDLSGLPVPGAAAPTPTPSAAAPDQIPVPTPTDSGTYQPKKRIIAREDKELVLLPEDGAIGAAPQGGSIFSDRPVISSPDAFVDY
jgi:chemotaxis protein MotB